MVKYENSVYSPLGALNNDQDIQQLFWPAATWDGGSVFIGSPETIEALDATRPELIPETPSSETLAIETVDSLAAKTAPAPYEVDRDGVILKIVLPPGFIEEVTNRTLTQSEDILDPVEAEVELARLSEEEEKRRSALLFTDGVRSVPFSFEKTFTLTLENILDYSFIGDFSLTGVGAVSILGDGVDSSVKGVDQINNSQVKYNDFVYNTLTDNKIISSFKEKTAHALVNMLSLDGLPFERKFSKAIKNALVRGEVGIFTEQAIEPFKSRLLNNTQQKKSRRFSENNRAILDSLLSDPVSIDPSIYGPITRNRLLNWRVLAEDVNKHIVCKTSDGTETNIYVPNSEKIQALSRRVADPTFYLQMQDGDYFVAKPNSGENRLKVHSDIHKAKALPPQKTAYAAGLLVDSNFQSLEVCSATSNLVEYNVDTTEARSDYYFLKLDRDTISDLPSSNLLTRKTSATYDYTTTGIDEYVKHKAMPYAVIYLRNDDMLFNHLEISKKALFTQVDFTLDGFIHNIEDTLLVRNFPQHIVLIPTDRLELNPLMSGSKYIDFTTRRLELDFSPFLNDTQSFGRPFYLNENLTTTGLNFALDTDTKTGVIYQEGRSYSLDITKLTNLERYKNKREVLPRKVSPTGQILAKVNALRTTYGLSSRSSISTFDLYSRLSPTVFRSLHTDQSDPNIFEGSLRINKVTDDDVFNAATFLKVKDYSEIGSPLTLLPQNLDAQQVTSPGFMSKKEEV
tara:strand:- start:161 stop:2380 length:2220 start_codon:yes stop_codon:yes gene_type:complete